MAFNHKYNTDDVHSRAVIVGLINLLNNRIQFENRLSDTEVDIVEVPWFFGKSLDERFMQDYFTFWNDCIHPKLASGNYDPIPRGVILLSSKSINSSALTHRFVRGSYVKEIQGRLETFNSYINPLPLKMTFDCTVKTASYLDAFKIEQAIIETFYKVAVFNVSFRGFRLPCQVGFPEDYGLEKNFEYSYGDDNEVSLKFTLELETYYPVIDKTSERHASNKISSFGLDFETETGSIRSLEFLSPIDNTLTGGTPETYYSGSTLVFQWNTIGSILRIDLEFSEDAGSTWVPIVKHYVNTNSYTWTIPNFQEKTPIVILSQETTKKAILRPIVNNLGQIANIIIFDGGSGYDNTLSLSIEEPGGNVTTPALVEPLIVNGEITGFNIINAGAGYTPTQEKNVSFRIKDSNTHNVMDIVNNIVIK